MPSHTTCSSEKIFNLLQECIRKKDLASSHLVHSLLVSSGLDSIGFFRDHLIRAFASCSSLLRAYQTFCKSSNRTLHSWNAIITAYVQLESYEGGIQLFQKMEEETIKPDKFTFLALLKASKYLQALETGQLLHGCIAREKLEADKLISSTLIDVYADFGCLEDAHKLFKSSSDRDVVLWNVMLSSYVLNAAEFLAFELFESLQRTGLKPDKVTFSYILRACGNTRAPKISMLIHDQINQEGLESDTMVGNSIIDMYIRCGSSEAALNLFEKTKHQSVVAWNIMIAGYAQHGSPYNAMELFEKMHTDGMNPDTITFSCILQACGMIQALEHGRVLHHLIVKAGVEGNVAVKRMLVDMYVRSGRVQEAYKLCSHLWECDLLLLTSLMTGYVQNGDGVAALELFEELQEQGFAPNDVFCSLLLKACGTLGALEIGKLVHDIIIRCWLQRNVVIESALIDMYTKCGSLDNGQYIFDRMLHRDLVSWNTLIAGYVLMEEAPSSLLLFKRMQYEGTKPDNFTFSCVLKACTDLGVVETGRMIHDWMMNGDNEFDLVSGNTLIDMYAKFGYIEDAYSVFCRLPCQDVVSWNSVLAGYTQQEQDVLVFELFERMQHECINMDITTYSYILRACSNIGAVKQGQLIYDIIIRNGVESDIIIESKLVDMFVNCGSLEEACNVFHRMKNRNTIAWNLVITGCLSQGDEILGIALFMRMQLEGFQPDKTTYLTVLRACMNLGAVLHGRLVHMQIVESLFDTDLLVGSALIDMYGKCDSLEEATNIFDRLPNRDIATWNAMVCAYARQADCSKVNKCLIEMHNHGLKPDSRTYSSILASCSHAGKIKEGYRHFKAMKDEHGITPTVEHFTCMVDLLSRAGCFDEAEELLETSPVLCDALGWRALLSACRTYGGVETGKHYYDQAVLSNPDNSSGYMLMCTIYMDSHMWDGAYEIQRQRISHGAWRKPGKACIEIDSMLHEFIVGDMRHMEGDKMLGKLKGLLRAMGGEGYVPQVASVIPPPSDLNRDYFAESVLLSKCSIECLSVSYNIGSVATHY